jgi:hypothetical protein
MCEAMLKRGGGRIYPLMTDCLVRISLNHALSEMAFSQAFHPPRREEIDP